MPKDTIIDDREGRYGIFNTTSETPHTPFR